MEKEARRSWENEQECFFCIEIGFYWSDLYNINDQFIQRQTERTENRGAAKSQKPVYRHLRINKISPHRTSTSHHLRSPPPKVDTLNNNKFYVGRETFLSVHGTSKSRRVRERKRWTETTKLFYYKSTGFIRLYSTRLTLI